MHVLTSSDILSRISRYQDGCCARDLKYQPDKLAKNGHFNLINEESFYRPTPQAYEKILESGSVVNPDSNPSNSIEKLHYLLNVLKIPFSFLIGDSACLHGNNDALHFLLHYTKAPIHTLISYKGVLNAATKGHLGILKFLNPHYNLHSTEALHLAMCNKHKHIVDWYILSNEVTVLHGVVPSSMLYSALVYYIELGEVDTCLRIMTGNPVLLCIQKRSTKAVDMCASRGNLELLKILFAYHGRESHNALDKAAANGHLEIVKYLTGNSDRTSLHPTLDELHRSHDSTSSLNSSLNSSLGTNLGSVGQLHAPRLMLSSTSNSRSDLNVLPPRNSSSDLNIMDRSAVSSHLHSRTPTPNGVESPRHKGKYTIHASKNAITQACCNGHIDVVEYLLFNRFEGYDVKIYDLTAATGNVDTLRYIDEHRLDYFPNMFVTLDAMDNAAAEGHLEAVQYLSNREGCTTDAMDNAASNGHLNVVQWLNENRHEGCTSRAMDDAAGNGRLDILQYLTEMHVHNNRNVLTSPDANVDTLDIRNITTVSGTPVITSRAIDLAAEHGHIDVLKFIRARYNSYLTTIHNVNMTNNHTLIGPSRLAFDLAAGNGHLEVLEFLVENYENLCSVASIELAARSGHVHVLQWFFEKFPEMFAKQKVDYADNNTLVLGYGSCVVQKRSPDKHAGGSNKRIKSNEDTFVSPLTEALSLAVRHGQCESVLWMQNTVELYPTSSDCDWASRNGHLSLLVFMMTNDYGIDVEPPCPSIRSLDWAVLNSHMDVVQYLLTLPPRSVPNENICSSASSPALPRPTMFTRAQALNFAERYGLDNVTNMLNSLPETTVEPNVHRDHSNTTTSSSFHSSTEPSKSTVRLLSPSSVSLLSPGTVPMDSK